MELVFRVIDGLRDRNLFNRQPLGLGSCLRAAVSRKIIQDKGE
jgi:hypothetical protein